MNRKELIAISSAIIMSVADFAGIMVYSSNNVEYKHTNINNFDYYADEYSFKKANTKTYENSYNGNVKLQNINNDTIGMKFIFYKGINNVTAQMIIVYFNGKLIHASLLINNGMKKNYNYVVVPLYSRANNYMIQKISPTMIYNKTLTQNNSVVPEYSYSQVCNIYSTGVFDWFLSFNNAATQNLITDMTSLSVLMGYLGVMLGSTVVGSIIAFLASAILAIGSYAINEMNNNGGLHGVYFDGPYGSLTGFGSPWTHPVPWWA